MKIAIVCQHFYPEEFRINDLAFELAKKGHDITVLTGLPNYPLGKVLKPYKWFRKRNETIKGVKIKRTFLLGRGTSLFRMAVNYFCFAVFTSIKSIFIKKDFDIIYVYQISPVTMAWPGIMLKWLTKKPLIIHCLDQWPISVTIGPIKKSSFVYKIVTAISKWTYNRADLITISSKSFKEYFIHELDIKEKGFTYYPSYAEDAYGSIEYQINETFDLVFAGNIGPAQSVETIIECANLLKEKKNIKFHIVGDGLSKANCESMAKEYGLENVIFYGFHPVEKMPEFYSVADAFLITMEDNEVVNQTLPAKIQSYMLAGKPIIGAINGEVKDTVELAQCGVCCKSLDYKALSELIIQVSNEQENLSLWGENGKKYYRKNFEKEGCIQKLEHIFQETCGKGEDV